MEIDINWPADALSTKRSAVPTTTAPSTKPWSVPASNSTRRSTPAALGATGSGPTICTSIRYVRCRDSRHFDQVVTGRRSVAAKVVTPGFEISVPSGQTRRTRRWPRLTRDYCHRLTSRSTKVVAVGGPRHDTALDRRTVGSGGELDALVEADCAPFRSHRHEPSSSERRRRPGRHHQRKANTRGDHVESDGNRRDAVLDPCTPRSTRSRFRRRQLAVRWVRERLAHPSKRARRAKNSRSAEVRAHDAADCHASRASATRSRRCRTSARAAWAYG